MDRYVILCDGMILVCKIITGKRSSTSSTQQGEFRLRDKHLIRKVRKNKDYRIIGKETSVRALTNQLSFKVDVLDREDTTTERHTFELAPREQPKIVFKAESEDEKNSWMAALVMLNTKCMLERLLDVILSNEEKKHPLRFPPADRYELDRI